MKRVPLTQGKFALVDDEDFEWLSRWTWSAYSSRSGNWYATRRVRVSEKYDTTSIKMHQQILGHSGVDHRDGDSLNNQRSNLRAASVAQNNANSSSCRGSTSKYKGVSWHKRGQKWSVFIQRRYLGLFETEIEAAGAYDKAALETFGEFAKLNLTS